MSMYQTSSILAPTTVAPEPSSSNIYRSSFYQIYVCPPISYTLKTSLILKTYDNFVIYQLPPSTVQSPPTSNTLCFFRYKILLPQLDDITQDYKKSENKLNKAAQQEPEPKPKPTREEKAAVKLTPFTGVARRLDGSSFIMKAKCSVVAELRTTMGKFPGKLVFGRSRQYYYQSCLCTFAEVFKRKNKCEG